MKRVSIVVISFLLDFFGAVLIVVGCGLLFGTEKDSTNYLITRMYYLVHDYQVFMVNKWPLLQSYPEISGVIFCSLGFLCLILSIYFLKKLIKRSVDSSE